MARCQEEPAGRTERVGCSNRRRHYHRSGQRRTPHTLVVVIALCLAAAMVASAAAAATTTSADRPTPVEQRGATADADVPSSRRGTATDTSSWLDAVRPSAHSSGSSRQTSGNTGGAVKEGHTATATAGSRAPGADGKDLDTFFAPMSLRFDVTHLYTNDTVCTQVGQLRADFLSHRAVVCTPLDLLTASKRSFIVERVLPVVHQRITRLFRVKLPFKSARGRGQRLFVPQGVCGPLLPIPAAHTSSGLPDTDIVIYVLAAPLPGDGASSSPFTPAADTAAAAPVRGGGGNAIAWSGHCGVDGNGRPAVARINFVPRFIAPHGPRLSGDDVGGDGAGGDDAATVLGGDLVSWRVESYVRAVMHEVLHALGFAPPFLRALEEGRWGGVSGGGRLDGAEREPINTTTSRPASSDAGVAPAQAVERCTAPLVVRAAREYFGCDSIDGVPLENEGGAGSARAHWERRLLREEVMAAAPSAVSAVSALTLAYFQSLPFYDVDMRYAEGQMRWGRGAGCGFVEGACGSVAAARAWGLAPPSADSSSANSTERAAQPAQRREAVEALLAARHWCLDFSTAANTASAAASGGGLSPWALRTQYISQCTADRRAIGSCRRDAATGQSPFMGSCPVVESSAAYYTAPILASPATAPGPRGSWVSPLSGSGGVVRQELDGDVACTVPLDLDVAEADMPFFRPASRPSSSSIAAASDQNPVTGDGSYSSLPQHFFGAQSRCLHILSTEGSFVSLASNHMNESAASSSSSSASPSTPPVKLRAIRARCLRVRCPLGRYVEVQVNGAWHSCPRDGSPGTVAMARAQGFLACEDARVMCDPQLYYTPPPAARPLLADAAASPPKGGSRGGVGGGGEEKRGVDGREVAQPLLREVVVTMQLGIQRVVPKSARPSLSREQRPAVLSSSNLSDDSAWATTLLACDGEALVALQTDISSLLGPTRALDVQMPPRAGRVRVVPPSTLFVATIGSEGGAAVDRSQRRDAGEKVLDSTFPVHDGASSRSSNSNSSSPSAGAERLIATLTLAVTVPAASASTASVAQQLRSLEQPLLDAVARGQPLAALSSLAGSQSASALFSVPRCQPSWMLFAPPGAPTATPVEGGEGDNDAPSYHPLILSAVDVRATHDPPLVLDGPSALEAVPVADLTLLLRMAPPTATTTRAAAVEGDALGDNNTPSTAATPPTQLPGNKTGGGAAAEPKRRSSPASKRDAGDASKIERHGNYGPEEEERARAEDGGAGCPRLRAAWLLTPDAKSFVVAAARDDVARLLRVSANLIAIHAAAPAGQPSSLWLSATIHAPTIVNAQQRQRTRAAWDAVLQRAVQTGDGGGAVLSFPDTAAAVYRALNRVVLGAATLPSPSPARHSRKGKGERRQAAVPAQGWNSSSASVPCVPSVRITAYRLGRAQPLSSVNFPPADDTGDGAADGAATGAALAAGGGVEDSLGLREPSAFCMPLLWHRGRWGSGGGGGGAAAGVVGGDRCIELPFVLFCLTVVTLALSVVAFLVVFECWDGFGCGFGCCCCSGGRGRSRAREGYEEVTGSDAQLSDVMLWGAA